MSLFSQTKPSIRLVSFIGFIATSNLVVATSAQAFSINLDTDTGVEQGITDGGFEEGFKTEPGERDWVPIGDTTTVGTFDDIAPLSGASQAITTTGRTSGTDDFDSFDPPNPLNFNQSGSDPVNADLNPNDSTSLQNQTSLSPEALTINRAASNPQLEGDSRTSKEGSGFYQDFTITIEPEDIASGKNGFTVSFNAAYLTNDGVNTNPGYGNQDYGFFSLLADPENTTTNDISVLYESDDSIVAPVESDNFYYEDTTYYTTNNQYSETVTLPATPGDYTYRAAFGVVDVDSYDRTSALMVDNFTVQQVPFEFSPALGLLIVGSVIGGDRLRRHLKHKSPVDFN